MKVEIEFKNCEDCPYHRDSGLYGWDCDHPNADDYEWDDIEGEKKVFPAGCPWLKKGIKLDI